MIGIIINGDYKSRGLSFCQFCGFDYDIGLRIPKILTNCGHTFCTMCIDELHRKDRIKCPICRKVIKDVKDTENIPMNYSILYECVLRNKDLARLDLNSDADVLENEFCLDHPKRSTHFYCTIHGDIFC